MKGWFDMEGVKILSDRAMKFGAPKEEAYCLGISRMCCEQCSRCRIFDGKCNGIWKNKDYIDYKKFICRNFVCGVKHLIQK